MDLVLKKFEPSVCREYGYSLDVRKGVLRALRGCVLVHSALHNILIDDIMTNIQEADKSKIKAAYDDSFKK